MSLHRYLAREIVHAIPYLIAAALFGASVSYLWSIDWRFGAGLALAVAVGLIGRDIWVLRDLRNL